MGQAESSDAGMSVFRTWARASSTVWYLHSQSLGVVGEGLHEASEKAGEVVSAILK